MCSFFFFFFNDTATTEIYTLSLHDALPISTQRRPAPHHRGSAARAGGGARAADRARAGGRRGRARGCRARPRFGDRKSTRLNSSHSQISYAVFCLKKKKNAYATLANILILL